MGQVRWASCTMAVATVLVMSGGQLARADVASDKPAAIVVYPLVAVDANRDTVIRLTNTSQTAPINVHCFYLDANSHCSNDGDICTSDPSSCGSGATCVPGWQETDFDVVLTVGQPIQWKASKGLADADLPLEFGFCALNQFRPCGSDDDCLPANGGPGGKCTQSNAGTRVPPVAENPFEGELKCIAVDNTGTPVGRNDLKGEGLIETLTSTNFDVASYNAIGIQAKSGATFGNVLVLGGTSAEYNGCPNILILDHFFDEAQDPVPGSHNTIDTHLVLVPCTEDLLNQVPGSAVVQYLVYNEFEQRFSTSKKVACFQDLELCNIDTPDCSRSIFNVAVSGTLSGQTRMNPIGVAPLPSGLLGVAVEHHIDDTDSGLDRSAAFNLHMSGDRTAADTITIPQPPGF